MSNKRLDEKQGHWILAKMGKKVLRPGGKELTLKMIKNLEISNNDKIVEFAPGLEFTALIALENKPKSYTGVELNREAVSILNKTLSGDNVNIIVGNATNSTLEDSSQDKVYGEAMLTMQASQMKSKIIGEAYRILKQGGRYGIHELGLTPNNLDEETKKTIQKELANVIKVNARPLTENEWVDLIEKEGFKVIKVETNPMHLLEPKRVIEDEGFFRTLKIIFNVITNPKARKRILAMRKVFCKYENHLNAISIIAEKK